MQSCQCHPYCVECDALLNNIKPLRVSKLFRTQKVMFDIHQSKWENRTTNYLLKTNIC